MRTAVIVVNNRTPELALRCVDAVLPQLRSAGGGCVCVVAQTALASSSDAVRQRLSDASPDGELKLVEIGPEGGLARGINLALSSLDGKEPPEHLWIVSSDHPVEAGALSSLFAELERATAIGVVGWRAQASDYAALDLEQGTPLEAGDAPAVSGHCMMIRRRVMEDVGPFDEALIAPFDVMDFCARARRVGWRVRPVVGHDSAGNAGEVAERAQTLGDCRAWLESRSRYLKKHHGILAASLSEVASIADAAVHATKSMLGRDDRRATNELADVARQALSRLTDLSPLSPDDVVSDQPVPHDAADFVQLVREDFVTHASDLTEPGFWALLAHRLGSHGTRAPIGRLLGARVGQRVLSTAVDWAWGIHIAETARVGRRVRIWHSGCIVVDAREIGDDVQLRHNTTIGPERGHQGPRGLLPVIGDRAELGAGACVLGAVTVGEDATIGANTVVLKDVPSGGRVLGVPARPIPI